MGEFRPSATPVADAPPGTDPAALIEAMRVRGAERFDPVGFRFIEALARRAAAHRNEARRVLERRLAELLADYGERFDRAEREARDTVASATRRFPQAVAAMRQGLEAGDFGALQRLLAGLEAQGGAPLAELLAHIQRRTATAPTSAPGLATGAGAQAQGELKSLRYFRRTLSKLSVDRQLSRALAQAPENAGPLNSHFLVLQSLTLMRDTAPSYLEQFMSYVDALLWLDQADNSGKPTQKNAARSERDKKRKSGRRKGD